MPLFGHYGSVLPESGGILCG